MLARLWEARFKIITLSFCMFLALFIITLLICVVTHTTLQDLVSSLASAEIQFAIRLSLFTSVISTIICIAVAVPAAYALARYQFWGRSLINTITDTPMALPPLVAGIGLLILFGTTPFGKGLANIGLDFVFTVPGIIIAQFFVNVPFMLRIMRSTFLSINPRYENVARTLGCSDAQAFWRVTIPMSRNGLLAGSVITWCKGIGEFGAVLILAGATRMKTEVLPISLYLNMSTGDLSLAIAAATILIIISVTSLFIVERYGGFSRVF
jgi:molybdate transport system permease protein